VDSLKVLDPERPIREADINRNPLRLSYRRYNMSLCLDIWMPAAQLKLLQP
jgi:hypothetical protein